MNFAVHIERSCKMNPNKTCVVQGNFRLTYEQMEERVNRLVQALIEMELKPGVTTFCEFIKYWRRL